MKIHKNIDSHSYLHHDDRMYKYPVPKKMALRRITVNLPAALIGEAMKMTKLGITETLIEALNLVRRRRAYHNAMALKGKIKVSLDMDKVRERTHR